MKEKLTALWAKVVDNKEVVIKIGAAVLGAVIGAVIATVVEDLQQETLLEEVEMTPFDEIVE